jgi:hypothetical protein
MGQLVPLYHGRSLLVGLLRLHKEAAAMVREQQHPWHKKAVLRGMARGAGGGAAAADDRDFTRRAARIAVEFLVESLRSAIFGGGGGGGIIIFAEVGLQKLNSVYP